MSFSNEKIFNDINQFLNSTIRNTYLYNEYMTLYVRKSKRFIEGKWYDCFDIASVEVIRQERGKGYFTSFLQTFIELYPDKNIFVESILNPVLKDKLLQFDFKEQVINNYQLNMFLIY